MPTFLITISSARHSAAQLEARLRQPAASSDPGLAAGNAGATAGHPHAAARVIPVLARIEDERLVLDLRTVFPEQEPVLTTALVNALP